MRTSGIVLLSLYLLLVSFSRSEAMTIVVDGSGEAGQDGVDFTEVQAAIDAARQGDVVLVVPGTYELCTPLSFRGKTITVRSDGGAESTTLRMCAEADNPDERSVVTFAGGEGPNSVLQGFTITGGSGRLVNCFGSGDDLFCLRSAGGILCENSSPTVVECVITRNTAYESSGGGAYCGPGTHPTFLRCVFSSNHATLGAGVCCGQDSAPSFVNCLFSSNTADGDEGGDGGGLYCSTGSTAVLKNCTFADNEAYGQGSGIYCWESSLQLVNCVVTGGLALEAGAELAASHSCIFDRETWPGPSVINADPEFVDYPDDLRLASSSPCIDTGTPEGAPSTDLAGHARPCGDGVDMGAFETGACDRPQYRAVCARGSRPEPVVVGNRAVAFALSLKFRGTAGRGELRSALFRNIATGDASKLVRSARLYLDDGDGAFDEEDRPIGRAATFAAATGELRLDRIGHTGEPGTTDTLFLVCELTGNRVVHAISPVAAPRSRPAIPVPAACIVGLAAALLLSRGRRSALEFVLPICLLCCVLAGCGGGGSSSPPAEPLAGEIEVQLLELDVRNAGEGEPFEIEGLPLEAWPFDV